MMHRFDIKTSAFRIFNFFFFLGCAHQKFQLKMGKNQAGSQFSMNVIAEKNDLSRYQKKNVSLELV